MKNLISLRLLSALVCGLFLFSCASTRSSDGRFEYISREEQSLSAVLNTPTVFTVSEHQSILTWKRALIFLDMYTGDKSPVVIKQSSKRTLLQSSKNIVPFRYKIITEQVPGNSVRFSVKCYYNNNGLKLTNASKKNAHNLARFLTSGLLERDYLKEI